MTFASEVKKECTLIDVHREHAKAELTALIRMNGAVSIYQQSLILNIQSENAAIARRIFKLFKQHFNLESELIVRRKMKLKKNNVYIVRCRYQVKEVLEILGIFDGVFIKSEVDEEIIKSEAKKRSYLRGAFLAGGSVNHPESTNYHLEIYSNYEDHNDSICKMMNDFGLHARTINRRNGYITYIKEAEKIAEFLGVIGATRAMLKFEDVRIVRDMRNSVNRLVNCENANINKVVEAANRQCEAIERIQTKMGIEALPLKLQEVALFRLENPDLGLKELGEQLPSGPISKSGVNHRMRKLMQIAESLA